MHPKTFNPSPSRPAKTTIIITSFLFALFLTNLTHIQPLRANPFLGTTTPSQDKKQAAIISEKPRKKISFLSQAMMTISSAQLKMKKTMTKYIRDYKENNNWAPLMPLFLLSFLYGVIHAAGPGHGKGIAVAYTLSKGGSYTSGLTLGTLIALFHAGSAIAVVLILQIILHKNVTTNLDGITQKSQLISYGLLTVIGVLFLISAFKEWFAKAKKPSPKKITRNKPLTNPVTAALAIGMAPCPGVIMILLFCLSLGQLTLGVLLGITVSIGMALTITLAVWITLAGKKIVFSATSHWNTTFDLLEKILHTTSALLLTCIGAILFYTAL